MQTYKLSFAKERKGPAVVTLSTKLPVFMITGQTSTCRLQPAEAVELSDNPDFDGPHLVKKAAVPTPAPIEPAAVATTKKVKMSKEKK